MKKTFLQKNLVFRIIAFAIIVNFILTGAPMGAYALKAPAAAKRDGGTNEMQSELTDYANSQFAPFVKIFAENFKVGGKDIKEQEKNVGQVILLKDVVDLYKKGKLLGSLLAHSANRKAFINELSKFVSREETVARYNEIINHRIKALLDTEIEIIPVCVGSEKKEIALEEQIQEIGQQLEKYFEGISEEDLKGKVVKVYFEPTALIGKIAEANKGADVAAEEDMIRAVHQSIFNWLGEKYGDETAKSLWGKSFLVGYGASVDGKNIDRVMAVKSTRPDMEGVPLVHGVLFATSGKDVLGFLEVAEGVQRAAIRDNARNARYDCFVNLKNFNVTIANEYIRAIYNAVYQGRINPAKVALSIADNDNNLEGWYAALEKAEKNRQEIDQVAMENLLFDLGKLTDTQTFSQLRSAINRLSPEQIERLRVLAKAEKFSQYDIEKRLSYILKPVNIFVSAGNAVIFSEGGFKSWLDMWEPGQNIVAIKTLKGSKQLDAAAFVQQNFYSGAVFARYQIPGLHLGEPVNVGGTKIDTIVVPEDKNVGRPELRILYFGPEISNKKAIEILRKLGIGPDVVAEYGPGKDEGGRKGGTETAKRIREFVAMGLPVACASPVNKDGIKVALKSLGLNPKIAFKEALYSSNRDKVTSNVWVVDTLSCTSNAMISVVFAMNEAFGVEEGSGETDHAMTPSNAIFPQPSGRARERVDVLRGMSIVENIQPASTGAAKNLFKIIPGLETNFPIAANRIGVVSGSKFTLTMRLKREVTEQEVREALRNFAKNKSNGMVKFFEGIPGVVNAPLDTNAIVGWSEVSIIDGFQITVLGNKKTVVINGYYDNESAAPGQIASRWAPHMVDVRRVKELLVPSPVNIETAKVANPPYMSSWGRKDYEGKKVLERLDLNIPDVKGAPKKITAAVKTVVTPLENGAKTVIVLSHRGRPDGKVDMDSSMGPVAEKFKELVKGQGYDYEVIFHPGSITNKGLVKGLKQKIVPGAINILEDTRFYEGEEGNDWVFAAGLADLVNDENGENGVFIFDAFGAGERTGGSLDLVAHYVEKIGLGFIMEEETNTLQAVLDNLYSIFLGGGPKVSEKIPIVKKAIPNIKEGGFVGIGTGPCPAFLKALYNIEIGTKFSEQDLKYAQEIITLAKQHGIELVLPSDFVMLDKDLNSKPEGSEKSWLELKKIPEGAKIYHVTLEQLKKGTFVDGESGKTLSAKDLFPYDIYTQTIKEVSDRVRGTPKGLWNVWNGAPGVNEIPQFEAGSRGIGSEGYAGISQNNANAALIGSDTGVLGEQIGIDTKVTYVSTGGSSALTIIQGKELLVMNGLRKAQADINAAKELGVKVAKLRGYNKAEQIVDDASGGNILTGYINDLSSKNIELKGKLLIVEPQELELGGGISAIRKLSRLAPAVGLYGPNVEKSKVLIGTKNIIAADNLDRLLDDVLKIVKPSDILFLKASEDKAVEAKLKKLNIRVVNSSQIAIVDAAKVIKEFSGSLEADTAFEDFLNNMVNARIIEVSDEGRQKLLAKLEEGRPPLEFSENDVKVTDRVTNDVGVTKAKETIREFI